MLNPFSKNSESVKANAINPKAATQLHLRIAEINDNTVVLKNGGLRAVLKVSSLNFNLKSEAEQNAIIYAYQSFLNTLEFPVQIVVRSRKLDIDAYLNKLAGIAKKHTNALLQKQMEEYIDYIRRLIEYADIMEKDFYVVVPMDSFRTVAPGFLDKFWSRMHPEENASSILKRHTEFSQLKKTLIQRVAVITSGLEHCGLKVDTLTTAELIALYYQTYNPITARNEKIADVSATDIKSDADLGR